MESILNYYMDSKNVIHNEDGSSTIVNNRDFLNYIRINIEGLSLSEEIRIIVLESKTYGILSKDNRHVLFFNKEVNDFEVVSFNTIKKIFPKSYIGNFILKRAEHYELVNGDIIFIINNSIIENPEDEMNEKMDELEIIQEFEDGIFNYAVVNQSKWKQCLCMDEESYVRKVRYDEFHTYKLTEI